jgi:hypothetical protein
VQPADQPEVIVQPDRFILTVINTGSEAITIRTIGFKTDVKDGGIELDWELTSRNSTATYPRPESPELPMRIEGHDCKYWIYEEAALEPIPAGDRAKGYAKRDKMFRGTTQGKARA